MFDRKYRLEGEPLISVVTPYYNAHEYFENLYPCVMNQTFPWFEWLIVNDGSTHADAIAQLNSLEARDSRIRVINKVNGGSSSARNKGIHESKTEIVITLDADELIESTYFEVLYWALYYNPECSWAYTDSVGFQAQEYTWDPPFDTKRLKQYNFLTESAAIRREHLLEVGGYDEIEKYYYEDWKLWLKLLSKSRRPIHVRGFEFWYRRTESGALNKIDTDKEMKRKADLLASESAKMVDESVEAKNFEGQWKIEDGVKPIKTDFCRPYLQEKKKAQVLLLIPQMDARDKFPYELVKTIDKKLYDVSVIATKPSDCEWNQKFREEAQDIFTLPDFLDPENYTKFLSYIIESRKIDVCVISNCEWGYYLIPWLRKEYPMLAMLDCICEGKSQPRLSAAMSELLDKTYRYENSGERIRNFQRMIDECMSEGKKQHRIEKSKVLQQVSSLTEELYAVYTILDAKEIKENSIRKESGYEKSWKWDKEAFTFYKEKVCMSLKKYGIKDTCMRIVRKLKG